jgi:5-formyltetrahydrofolate cyclo-ligase
MDITTQKTRTRVQAKARRQEFLQSGQADAAAIDIISHFPVARFKGKGVGGIWPLPGELDTRPLMQALFKQGFTLSLPCTPRKGKPLTYRAWTPSDKLKAGPYGTREPYSDKGVVFPTLVLVPMLAFTETGERLGYGGGFYDRTLAALKARGDVFACGVAFAAQEAAHLPTGEYDLPLDGILTEKYFKDF